MAKEPIGLIGVGLLGTALAERMLAAGLRVVGFDCDVARQEALAALGGESAKGARAIAATCPRIVLCLPDSAVVQAVIQEIDVDLPAGALLIDATTGDPETTVALAARLRLRGIGFVDATIAGSSEQVRKGDALVMAGGETGDVSRAPDILNAWSENVLHVGASGSGARMKLVVNLVLGLNRAVLAEGLSLARAAGIEPVAALEALRASPAYSRAMDTKGRKMIERDFAPQARLAQHLKDVRLIRALAARHGSFAPLSALHEDLLQQAVDLGLGEADNSAIIEVFERHQARGVARD